MGPFCIKTCWTRKDKFKKLYKEGANRIEANLDIVKIVNNLRMLKILMKNSLMSPEIKFSLNHSHKKYINLDEDDEDEG